MAKAWWGIRTQASDTAWVQTGLSKEKAEQGAADLNLHGTIPGVIYSAAKVK